MLAATPTTCTSKIYHSASCLESAVTERPPQLNLYACCIHTYSCVGMVRVQTDKKKIHKNIQYYFDASI